MVKPTLTPLLSGIVGTLALSAVTKSGIALAADSAITDVDPSGKRIGATPNVGRKVFALPRIQAAAAAWGRMTIGDRDMWDWFPEWAAAQQAASVDELAPLLASELGVLLGGNPKAEYRVGILLVGYVSTPRGLRPSMWHVHDGPSTTLAGRGIHIDPRRVNANHDCPPDILEDMFARDQVWTTRNGDIAGWADVNAGVVGLFASLPKRGAFGPYIRSMDALGEWLTFQIRLLADLYRFSSLPYQGVGGRIDMVTITPDGVVSPIREFESPKGEIESHEPSALAKST